MVREQSTGLSHLLSLEVCQRGKVGVWGMGTTGHAEFIDCVEVP